MEKAKEVYMKITSYSNRSELGGIEKDWIIKCINDALEEKEKQINMRLKDFAKYLQKSAWEIMDKDFEDFVDDFKNQK